MQKTITPNDLLLYVYNEAPADLAREIEEHIQWDTELRTELAELMKIKDALQLARQQPSQESCNRIKAFNQSYRVMRCGNQQVEMLLN